MCCVIYPAPPEALEKPAGVARDSRATQEEQSAHRWVWAGEAHHNKPQLWRQTQGMRRDEQGWESAREPWGKVAPCHEKAGLVWHLCKVLGGFLKVLVIEN